MGSLTVLCLSVSLLWFGGTLAQDTTTESLIEGNTTEPLIEGNATESLTEDRFDEESNVIVYSHYYANTSLWNSPVGCYNFEIPCLQLNMIYHEPSRQCVELHSEVGRGCSVVVDERAWRESRRLRAACYAGPLCANDTQRPMAFDGSCPERVACREGYALRRHPFGGAECACATRDCGPGRVTQPQFPRKPSLENNLESKPKYEYKIEAAPGLHECRFPDFQTPQKTYRNTRDLRGPFNCDMDMQLCLFIGKVRLEDSCYNLLSQGPCPVGQRVVLDKLAAEKDGKMVAKCKEPTAVACRDGSADAFGDSVCNIDDVNNYIQLRVTQEQCYW